MTGVTMGTVRDRYRDGVRELGGRQKTSKGAPAYSRWVNRWLGRRFAAAANVAGLTPNAVTGLSALLTFAAIATLATVRPTPLVGVLIGVGLALGYALDAADGQLARLQGTGSRSGEWLDHVVDAIKTASLHLAVLIAAFRYFTIDDAWLLVPLGYSVVSGVFFFTMTLTDQLRRSARGKETQFMAADGSSSTLYSLAVAPTDYGILCLALGLVGWQDVFVPVYTLLFVATAGFVLLALPKWYREIRTLG
ncbi:CDP-alcohol phosphatidyltransferase family protein [Cellulomonas sp. URHD0024]|uniref:CDP-alcohol phosphatidyltransferase family protein n=1 Tax=Cellulomonas sp. URHD0024 TaxID=1302620 RepID=UPI0004066A91|nr:CDP-alcohol phosphatidyltransferase family protein [Cellulomonas sp. URHD0024]